VVILALDTTTKAGSCALWRDGALVEQRPGDAVRTHAEAPDRETGKTCARRNQVVEMRNGDALRLRRAVDVDELCQDELDLVSLEKLLFLDQSHCHVARAC